MFICNSNPGALIDSFVDGDNGLATQSTAQMIITKFLEIETSVKSKLNQTFSAFIKVAVARNCFCKLKMGVSKKKCKMIRRSLYIYDRINFLNCRITWKDIPTFSWSLASTEQIATLFLIKSDLLPLLVNEQDFQPIVIKKSS